jgi:hypothetical protein
LWTGVTGQIGTSRAASREPGRPGSTDPGRRPSDSRARKVAAGRQRAVTLAPPGTGWPRAGRPHRPLTHEQLPAVRRSRDIPDIANAPLTTVRQYWWHDLPQEGHGMNHHPEAGHIRLPKTARKRSDGAWAGDSR